MTTATRTLTERRAVDRLAMANAVEQLAASLGATVTRPDPLTSREIRLEIETPHGCTLGIYFDGSSTQPDIHVCTWNTRSDSLYAFSPAMGDVNPYHFSKVNRVCYGLDSLPEMLERDIPMLIDGRGYSAERSRKIATDRLERLKGSLAYIAPLVARGEGLGDTARYGYETPEELRRQHDVRLPALIAALEQFIADGCPVGDCLGFPWA